MDKQTLLGKIQSSKVSDDLKKELSAIVNAEDAIGPETIKKLQAKLDQNAVSLIDEVSSLQIMDADEKVSQQLDEVDKDVKDLEKEINRQADEIDLQQARAQIK